MDHRLWEIRETFINPWDPSKIPSFPRIAIPSVTIMNIPLNVRFRGQSPGLRVKSSMSRELYGRQSSTHSKTAKTTANPPTTSRSPTNSHCSHRRNSLPTEIPVAILIEGRRRAETALSCRGNGSCRGIVAVLLMKQRSKPRQSSLLIDVRKRYRDICALTFTSAIQWFFRLPRRENIKFSFGFTCSMNVSYLLAIERRS
jgi:hypothetical protein